MNKAKITIDGKITNAAIILLGKSESEHFISLSQAKITWILKDHKGDEIDYAHFDAPLLLSVNRVLSKIRNLTYRYIQENSLFTQEVDMYDTYVIREALHNCIAHQDYTLSGRVIVVEFPKRLVFSNEGDFIPENVREVLHRDSPDTFSRNKFLTNAMFNLNMIDTIGSGIKRMFNKQKDRYFPLPEYRIKKSTVSVEINGEILSLDYAYYLINHRNLTLDETIVLDKAQKGKKLSEKEINFLKNIGFYIAEQPSNQVSNQVSDYVTDQVLFKISDLQFKVLVFCESPKKRKEILEICLDLTNQIKNFKKHVEPLIIRGLLTMTIPDAPRSQFQRLVLTDKGRNFIQ